MDASLEEVLLAEAKREGRRTESARQTMLAAAIRRQEAIFGLHAMGMSIRAIASHLGCSASVVQNAIAQARTSRPKIDRRENRVTFELHRAIAHRLEADASAVIERGLKNVRSMRAQQRDPLSKAWMSRWEELLRGDIDELKRFLLEISPDAEDMRQMSPFMGVLSQEQRILAIKKASSNAA